MKATTFKQIVDRIDKDNVIKDKDKSFSAKCDCPLVLETSGGKECAIFKLEDDAKKIA